MSRLAIVWFRRDLRLADLPTLLSAAGSDAALGLYVLDDALLGPAGAPRRTFLFRCLRELDAALDGRLLVTRGDPVHVVPEVAGAVEATTVHVSADFGPYGTRRDERVADALGESELVATGSPYAVSPGSVTKSDGTPYRVFTPFERAWRRHGWRAPARTSARTVRWVDPPRLRCEVSIPDDDDLGSVQLPPAGEHAARARWRDFRDDGMTNYARRRDRPDRDATSRVSPYLKFGCLHPRTILADLDGPGSDTLRTELAWREFYADVLWHRPDTARQNLQSPLRRLPLRQRSARGQRVRRLV